MKEKEPKMFDPAELTESSKKLRSVYIQSLDRTIQFGPWTLNDIEYLAKCQNGAEKGYIILWVMLRKAYPILTLEEIKAWDGTKVQNILDAIKDFLSTKKEA